MLAVFPGTRVSVSKLLRTLLFGDLMDTDLGATGCKKERANPAQKQVCVSDAKSHGECRSQPPTLLADSPVNKAVLYMETSPDNEIRAALVWALLDTPSVWRLRPKVSSLHRREIKMGLNGKGHLGISGQIPYSSRMEQTKENGLGKALEGREVTPVLCLIWKLCGRTRPFSLYVEI